MDAGPFQPASAAGCTGIGFEWRPRWIFALPTGAAIWRDGSLHTVAVRATDGAGNLTPVTTQAVRKGVNKDANADGHANLAVGARDLSSNAGAAYVFPGSATGVPGGDTSTAATTLTGTAGSLFGVSLAQ